MTVSKSFGLWWGPMHAICCSVNVDGMVCVLKGCCEISTLHYNKYLFEFSLVVRTLKSSSDCYSTSLTHHIPSQHLHPSHSLHLLAPLACLTPFGVRGAGSARVQGIQE